MRPTGLRRFLRLSLVIGLLGSEGCAVGSGFWNFPVAHSAAGATVELELTGSRAIVGELLAVHDSGLIVVRRGWASRAVVLVPEAAILRIRVAQVGTYRELTAERRERLRPVSRYPQGVSAPLLRRVLDGYGQAELDRLAPAAPVQAEPPEELLARARAGTAAFRDLAAAVGQPPLRYGTVRGCEAWLSTIFHSPARSASVLVQAPAFQNWAPDVSVTRSR